MCLIIGLYHTHLWLDLYNIKISKWLKEVATIVLHTSMIQQYYIICKHMMSLVFGILELDKQLASKYNISVILKKYNSKLIVPQRAIVARKSIANVKSGLVQFTRYMSTQLTLRYGTSGSISSSLSLFFFFFFVGDLNESFFIISEWTNIGVFMGNDLFMQNSLSIFSL